jgi:hypothetical protein
MNHLSLRTRLLLKLNLMRLLSRGMGVVVIDGVINFDLPAKIKHGLVRLIFL